MVLAGAGGAGRVAAAGKGGWVNGRRVGGVDWSVCGGGGEWGGGWIGAWVVGVGS